MADAHDDNRYKFVFRPRQGEVMRADLERPLWSSPQVPVGLHDSEGMLWLKVPAWAAVPGDIAHS